jgi:urocanate hydratase
MAVHNFVGDSFRGATWFYFSTPPPPLTNHRVALHNGGGVGWGEVINGGFGLVLDGSDDAARRASDMLFWDVNNGVVEIRFY